MGAEEDGRHTFMGHDGFYARYRTCAFLVEMVLP